MHNQLKASENYFRATFRDRNSNGTGTTLAEKIGDRIGRRFEARFAIKHLRQLRKQIG